MALRLRTCLTKQAIGLTEADQKKLLDGAKRYNTGDRTQDYVRATQDILASLREDRAVVAAEIEKVTGEIVAPAPEPTQTAEAISAEREVADREMAAALAEAEARDRAAEEARRAFAESGEYAREAAEAAEVIETMTPRELATKDGRERYIDRLVWLFQMLHDTNANIRRAAHDFIVAFLNGVPKNALYREAIIKFAREQGVVKATIINRRERTSRVNPMFSEIVANKMVEDVRKVAVIKDPPPEYATPSILPTPKQEATRRTKRVRTEAELEAEAEARNKAAQVEDQGLDLSDEGDEFNAAAQRLVTAIRSINTEPRKLSPAAEKNLIAELKDLWKAVVAEGTTDFTDQAGVSLKSYFTAKGAPRTDTIDGKLTIVSKEIDADVRAQVEKDLRELAKVKKGIADDPGDYISPSTSDQWNTVGHEAKSGFFRDDGKPLTSMVPVGRIRIMVSQFLSKLAIKPTIHVYKSQADLKSRNPELYARAVAERPQGDFDTTSAVGYSFGKGEIIIFSDRAATEKQLKFVLAHETLGHFGFRAVMPGREFNAVMEMIYDSSDHVKAVVDAAMQAHNMPKAEAVEEYLADFAGTLENNLLKRAWYALKDFLNRLGFKFEDDMARFVINQARAYVRNGTSNGKFVDFAQIAKKWMLLETMQDPYGTGRYFQSHESYSGKNRNAADLLAGRIPDPEANEARSWAGMSENIRDWMMDKGIDTKEFGRRLLDELRTMNYAARENRGYRRLYDILRATVHRAAFLRSKYNSMMEKTLQPAFELGRYNLSRATKNLATKADLKRASEMLRITSLVKMRSLTEKELNEYGSLFEFVDGKARRTDAVSKLAAKGRFTLEQFQQGFEYEDRYETPMTAEQRQAIADDYDKRIAAKKDDAAEVKRLTKERDDLMAAKSYWATEKLKFEGIKDLTEASLAWKIYNEVRDTMDAAALDLLEANFAAAQGERDNVIRAVQKFLGREPTPRDIEFVQKIVDKYIDIRGKDSGVNELGELELNQANVKASNDFIAAFNAAVLGEKDDRTVELIKNFYDQAQAEEVTAGINGLKAKAKIAKSGRRRYIMQQSIQNLAMFELGKSDAELHAKQTIAHGYVPFGREGKWQVRVNAVDPKTGRIYKVKDGYREKLLYLQTHSKAEAMRSADYVNDIFTDGNEGGLYEMEVLLENGEYDIKKVRLEAVVSAALETSSVVADVNLNDVISAITQFSIELTPPEREKLIVGLTSQNARARTRLRRTGAPGEDPNVIKYVAQHLEAVASTVARKENRHHLTRLFDDEDGDSQRLWSGDAQEYERIKRQWEAAEKDPSIPDPLRQAYRREFEDYHLTYKVYNSQQYGNKYKTRGHRLLAFLDSQKDVEFTDFGSGEVTSKIRMMTTFAMLGASPATAILNYLSLPMNVLPALSARNSKNGFGGGYGMANSSTELTHALAQSKDHAQSEIKYWQDLLDDLTDTKLKAAGYTRLEAEFMHKEVGSGAMQAALTNALLGSARGKITSGAGQSAAKAWMFLFNYSEQMARRATGLATYRLEFKRAMEEANARGMNEVDAAVFAHEQASKTAVEMIENTLGEYAMFNRPALFRGGLAQFIFMFKMYPVNTIQMLAALDRKAQLAALGLLLLMSGVKGLPFAEDMMDIIDTIAQALGFGPGRFWKGSAERTMAEIIDWAAPGASPYLLRGAVNHWLPANIADRVSLSNIVPGTGAGLAGADIGRELIEVLGPFASFTQGMLATSSDFAKWTMNPSVQGLADVARASPVTMARAFGDAWTYYETGAIVNRKGYVVSEDLHLGTYLARLTGFYPSAAVRENDVVRLSTRLGNYRKDVASSLYSKYVVAKMSGDTEAMQAVLDRVDSWNEGARGTELELTNFRRSAERAYREATRTTTERYLRTLPKQIRGATQQTMNMLMLEEEQAVSN